MRIKFLRVVIIFIFVVIALNLFYIQVIRGQLYFEQSVNNRIRVVPLDGQRGRILDRNGIPLADNRLSFNIAVIPQDMTESDKLFDYLSNVLRVDKKELLQGFYRRKVTFFAPVVIAEDVNSRIAMVLEENKFKYPGLYIQESFKRWYPFGDTGSHILGYVGKVNQSRMAELKEYGYAHQSIVGYTGIEEKYDSFLKGEDGGLQIEVNSRGNQVRLLSVRDPLQGEDVQLTVDYRIQEIIQKALAENHGAIVIMNLDTGGILGMASSPAYDPNILVSSGMFEKAQRIFRDKNSPLLNRAIQGAYPPGSVFKVVASIAGLVTKKLNTSDSFFCKGSYTLGQSRFRCAHVHSSQDLFNAIAHSCNVYFYNVGLILGPEVLHKFANLLGLGSLTHIDLPSEEKGTIPSPMQRTLKNNQGWYKGDTLNFSIGQGEVLVTPIQIINMIATIAKNGRVSQPHLISSIGLQNITRYSTAKNVYIRQDILDFMHKSLRAVVIDPGGTAKLLDLEGLAVSGKTGTAQTVPGRNTHAWFVGYILEGKERIAFCVFLEYGGSSYYATRVARQILQEMQEAKIL